METIITVMSKDGKDCIAHLGVVAFMMPVSKWYSDLENHKLAATYLCMKLNLKLSEIYSYEPLSRRGEFFAQRDVS